MFFAWRSPCSVPRWYHRILRWDEIEGAVNYCFIFSSLETMFSWTSNPCEQLSCSNTHLCNRFHLIHHSKLYRILAYDRHAGHEDAYNFYLSQLSITIERAFWVFVHWWAILHAPLLCPVSKVGPLIESLVRLLNVCINKNRELASLDVPIKNCVSLVKTA